tara:strand:- start:923 stop:1918 length:996 start_codon:yes stop_codon:yes gene_type:complete
MQKKINSWLVTQVDEITQANYLELDSAIFLTNEIIIEVKNSAINFKDALALTGRAPIIRNFPLIPGIDLSGVVIESKNKIFTEGDKVFTTGWGLGELSHGGLSSHASTDARILQYLPPKFSFSEIMGLGTAGLTAMLAVMALADNDIRPDAGKVIVTGSSGAVGSIATRLLLKLGYEVTALTSRLQFNNDYLKSFGNIEVLDSNDFMSDPKMLSKEKWAGAIDVVGGKVLENIITQTNKSGVISICGQVLGLSIKTNLAPFILRGIRLIGIDSAFCNQRRRREAWDMILGLLDVNDVESLSEVIEIEEVYNRSKLMLDGKNRKRIITNNSH